MMRNTCSACGGSGVRKVEGWSVACLCGLPATYRKERLHDLDDVLADVEIDLDET